MTDSSTSSPAYQYGGFYPPRYTPVPDDLFDDVMAGLTGAELKVLLYIIRRTYGFKKDRDRISLSQMVEGITTRDGRRLDYGTGLSKQGVVTALKSLADKGYIIADRNSSLARGHETTWYALHVRGERVEVVKKVDQGSQLDPRELVNKVDIQETVQDTEGQEIPARDEPDEYAWMDPGDRQMLGQVVDDLRREFKTWMGPWRCLELAAAILRDHPEVYRDTFRRAMLGAAEEARYWTAGDRFERWLALLEDRLNH